MIILVENGSYHLNNFGDIAMLVACVDRLQARWPTADIRVLTHDPERLLKFCPTVTPVLVSGRDLWYRKFRHNKYLHSLPFRWLFKQISHFLTDSVSSSLLSQLHLVGSFLNELHQCDLVICVGGGYICDVYASHAIRALALVRRAQQLGQQTYLMGQGIGPLENPELRHALQAILPQVQSPCVKHG